MSEPAVKLDPPPLRMTLDQFLNWDDGTATRHELIGGEITAMAPPLAIHGALVANFAGEIRSRLKPPCRVYTEAGIRVEAHNDTYLQADLAVSCIPVGRTDRFLAAPLIVIEILSPSTEYHDRVTKLMLYRAVPSIQEIILVSTTEARAELWRRRGMVWEVSDLTGSEARLSLDTVSIDLLLAAAYEGVPIA